MGAAYDFLQKKEVPSLPPIEPPDPPEDSGDGNNGEEDDWSPFAILALFIGLILSLIFIYSQT